MLRDFGKKLKRARLAKSYSQKGLALALGLSDKTISSYESSRSYPNLEILEKITMVLDQPFEYFLPSSNKRKEITFYLEDIQNKQKDLDSDIQKLIEYIEDLT